MHKKALSKILDDASNMGKSPFFPFPLSILKNVIGKLLDQNRASNSLNFQIPIRWQAVGNALLQSYIRGKLKVKHNLISKD